MRTDILNELSRGVDLDERSIFKRWSHVRSDIVNEIYGVDLYEEIDVQMVKPRAPWFLKRNNVGAILMKIYEYTYFQRENIFQVHYANYFIFWGQKDSRNL